MANNTPSSSTPNSNHKNGAAPISETLFPTTSHQLPLEVLRNPFNPNIWMIHPPGMDHPSPVLVVPLHPEACVSWTHQQMAEYMRTTGFIPPPPLLPRPMFGPLPPMLPPPTFGPVPPLPTPPRSEVLDGRPVVVRPHEARPSSSQGPRKQRRRETSPPLPGRVTEDYFYNCPINPTERILGLSDMEIHLPDTYNRGLEMVRIGRVLQPASMIIHDGQGIKSGNWTNIIKFQTLVMEPIDGFNLWREMVPKPARVFQEPDRSKELKVLIWLSMGSSSPSFIPRAKEILDRHQPDVFVILQTKCSDSATSAYVCALALGFDGFQELSGPSNSQGGVWFFWKIPNVHCKLLDNTGRLHMVMKKANITETHCAQCSCTKV